MQASLNGGSANSLTAGASSDGGSPQGGPDPAIVGRSCMEQQVPEKQAVASVQCGDAASADLKRAPDTGTSADKETAEELAALGLAGPLPPVSGGTTFGAEVAGQPRMRWKSRNQFVLVLAGYCIGIGNLWRFPYLCGKHGGGAFLLAYFIMLVLVAAPLFIYETVLGQKYQRGPVDTFRKMAPRWASLAYMPLALALFCQPYYQMVVTYAFHYFIASFQIPLPWRNDPKAYFYETVLHYEHISETKTWNRLHPPLVGEYFAVWLITALCLVKGIHSAGKAAYVTVILPVIVIAILLVRCVFLEGAGDGILYYITPRFEKLFVLEVWGHAATQIIFSLAPGTGTCISLASYHDREYKGLLADCLKIIVSNSTFSIVGGFVVFSVVGNLAHRRNEKVEDLAASGEGLAFIAFAEILTHLGADWVCSMFAVLFFMTLFLLGLDSSFAVIETLQTYINDWIISRNPDRRITMRGNAFRLAILTIAFFLVGLPYAMRGGHILLEISDHFIPTYILVVTVCLEYIMLGFWYTPEQLLDDVHKSTGRQFLACFKYQLKYAAPGVLVVVLMMLVFSEIMEEMPERGKDQASKKHHGWGDHPLGFKLIFGIIPVMISLLVFFVPVVRFHVRRLAFSRTLSPEVLEATRKRAAGGGISTVPDAPLVLHRDDEA